jgi:hypothetical protein
MPCTRSDIFIAARDACSAAGERGSASRARQGPRSMSRQGSELRLRRSRFALERPVNGRVRAMRAHRSPLTGVPFRRLRCGATPTRDAPRLVTPRRSPGQRSHGDHPRHSDTNALTFDQAQISGLGHLVEDVAGLLDGLHQKLSPQRRHGAQTAVDTETSREQAPWSRPSAATACPTNGHGHRLGRRPRDWRGFGGRLI